MLQRTLPFRGDNASLIASLSKYLTDRQLPSLNDKFVQRFNQDCLCRTIGCRREISLLLPDAYGTSANHWNNQVFGGNNAGCPTLVGHFEATNNRTVHLMNTKCSAMKHLAGLKLEVGSNQVAIISQPLYF